MEAREGRWWCYLTGAMILIGAISFILFDLFGAPFDVPIICTFSPTRNPAVAYKRVKVSLSTIKTVLEEAQQKGRIFARASDVKKFLRSAQVYPYDEFQRDTPLWYWKSLFKCYVKDGQVVVYSVGPDKTDDGAKIAYDPTNGLVSKGDIWITVTGLTPDEK